MRYMLQCVHLLDRIRMQKRACSRLHSRALSARSEPVSQQLLAGDERTVVDTHLLSSIVDLVQFGAFVAFVTKYCANITQCTGPSMLPTISTGGDVLLTVPTSLCHFLGLEAPRLGDVIISISPSDRTQTVCKRIIGTPGDTLLAAPPPGWPASYAREVTVPRGHVWLQGDNTEDSTDSRSYGPVPLALIQAIVVFRLYPLRNAGRLPALPPERLSRLTTTSEQTSVPPERTVETTIRLPPLAPVAPPEPAACEVGTALQRTRAPSSLRSERTAEVLEERVGIGEPPADHDAAMKTSRAVMAELESLLPKLREVAAGQPDGCAELVDVAAQLAGAADELQRALQHHQRSSEA
mmetsp:Transcript_3040/g.6897  ORF Transcript_3040/g.6897 Transcript_3040/m.6897 type:complete len:352 (-) Transcript_3040:211-1266(-)